MTETHGPEHPVGHPVHHAGPTVNAYLAVFGALVVFTLVSFVVNWAVRQGMLTPEMGFTIILAVAVCKATLVGMFFMHLILDWRKVYFMILAAGILGTMLVIVLLPDIVLNWRHY